MVAQSKHAKIRTTRQQTRRTRAGKRPAGGKSGGKIAVRGRKGFWRAAGGTKSEPLMVKDRGTIYSPTYSQPPLTNFASVTTRTNLSTLNLNWRERDLPERARTKHVHRLHPYLGKFIPQLVEIFLRRYHPKSICDPFCGSGTALVEANVLGIRAVGCDISEFNCLLSEVKTAEYDLPRVKKEVFGILGRTKNALEGLFTASEVTDTDNPYLKTWFAPKARRQLLTYVSFIKDYYYEKLLKVIVCRAARSARLTTHFDLDFPKRPQTEPYYCYKHSRTCSPTTDALQFLHRYSVDTVFRIQEYMDLRTSSPVDVICGDARIEQFPPVDGVITSPPYVGLIDYHEQHRYAYELLDLRWRDEQEIGPAKRGASETAKQQYVQSIEAVFRNVDNSLASGSPIIVVISDRHGLYEGLKDRLDYVEEAVINRHVNRRTGRRNGAFYEQVLVWRKR
jgi:hypothetical protein